MARKSSKKTPLVSPVQCQVIVKFHSQNCVSLYRFCSGETPALLAICLVFFFELSVSDTILRNFWVAKLLETSGSQFSARKYEPTPVCFFWFLKTFTTPYFFKKFWQSMLVSLGAQNRQFCVCWMWSTSQNNAESGPFGVPAWCITKNISVNESVSFVPKAPLHGGWSFFELKTHGIGMGVSKITTL